MNMLAGGFHQKDQSSQETQVDRDAQMLIKFAAECNDRAVRIAELEAALKDITEYARAIVGEVSDPGVGILCAISNAERLLRQ